MGSAWKKLFGKEHSFTTLAHIPVHAIHKKIYLEIMDGEEGLKREMKELDKWKATEYIKSWEYVNKHGHTRASLDRRLERVLFPI
ncbi:MAG: hypothetical protein U5L95_03325 [Candidatus Saccharibacteria bacterium]|nr:hypothetical protein [Candidatus Saccharibacteria bacterium]